MPINPFTPTRRTRARVDLAARRASSFFMGVFAIARTTMACHTPAPEEPVPRETASAVTALTDVFLTAMTPDVAPASGGQVISLVGGGFVSGATTVTVAGAPASNVHVVTPTQLTFTAPAFSSPTGTSAPQNIEVTVSGVKGAPLPGFYYYPSTNLLVQALMGDVGITANAGNVSAWADQGAGAHDFTQPSTARQPTLLANYNNSGRGALAFAGTLTQAHSMASAWGAPIPQPLTIYLVADYVTSDYAALYSGQITTGATGASLYMKGGSMVARTNVAKSIAPAQSGAHVMTLVFNGASSSYWLDGAQVGGTFDIGTGQTAGLLIGAWSPGATIGNNNTFLNGHIAELRVLQGAEASNDIATTTSILAARWNVYLPPSLVKVPALPPIPTVAELSKWLPLSDAGHPIVMMAAGLQLEYAPEQAPDPLSGQAVCVDLILHCAEADAGTIDQCVRSVPLCTSASPWLDATKTPCCPQVFLDAYVAGRRAGSAPDDALITSMKNDAGHSYYPGVDALLDGGAQ